MAKKTIANQEVEVDDQGFMKNLDEWSKELAEAIAKEEGITALTEKHWQVIEFVRQVTKETKASPTVRKISKQSGINTKELYELFPGGPGKKAAKIAGAPKPVGCV